MNRTLILLVCAPLLVAGVTSCTDVSKPPAGVARANSNGCYDLADAVSSYNRAIDGVKNGTATAADVQKDLAAAVKHADQADRDLAPGNLKAQAQTLSLHIARARVAIDSTGSASSALVEDPTIEAAFQQAAGSCSGILR